jgi:hypothetical protein
MSIVIADAAETVKAAYYLTADPNRDGWDWVPLTRLRAELEGTLTRGEVDAAIRHLFLNGQFQLIAEVNRKALTPADREAAIYAGGEDKHLIRRYL